ncbi:FecCD family ABC transporter permease [Parachitinimonas caeni]|uniref:Iron ABC transporter permease n=1 Tax=Parachitinimonas caeni TaxID=3031301 RepID=A0ABT7E2K5_9NEIS|nr:iron ABC transporter permease [Parachitinimonas caeni]MDK2125142.1 iron ABC transporter permease [Parachitinimonas caeni]
MNAPLPLVPRALEAGTLGLRWGPFSLLIAWRPLLTGLLLLLALAGAIALALLAGDTWFTPADLWAVLSGRASPDQQLLMIEFRLPRILVGLLAGAALGLAGCLTQALSRNRLAVPDVLGVSDGATLGAVVGLIASTSGMLGPWWTGPLGALVAIVLLLLAAGRHAGRGEQILVVGLAIAALLRAFVELLLSRQDLTHAGALYNWSTGSLSGRGLDAALPLTIGLACLFLPTLLLLRQLNLLRLDPDIARTLGVNLQRTRLLALLIAVLLAGLAVGLCGPIAFVALAAPWLASRLAGGGRLALLGSALTGALLIVLADTGGRILLAGNELPAGVVCNLLGGPFLLWLLFNEREGEAR